MHEEKKIDIHRRWENRGVEERIALSAFIFFFLHYGLHVFCTLLTEEAVFSLDRWRKGEERDEK